jgi:hypothetical protein
LSTNASRVRVRLCKLQKGYTRLAAASDKAYQLLAHGWWFSPDTSAIGLHKNHSYHKNLKIKQIYILLLIESDPGRDRMEVALID